MKKITALLLSLIFVLTLASCAGSNDSTSSSESTSESEALENSTSKSNDKTESQGAATESQSKKALVVYFSASGNTKRVATEIADAAGADLFEIEPKEAYTDDDLNWSNSNSRVSREHEDESLRNVELATTDVENWESYDTVFVGYPIWWGIAAWPVSSFVEKNDFSQKTVIPFATSASSGLGESVTLLEQSAKGGNWQSGQRFSSSASAQEVQSWVSGLEF